MKTIILAVLSVPARAVEFDSSWAVFVVVRFLPRKKPSQNTMDQVQVPRDPSNLGIITLEGVTRRTHHPLMNYREACQ